MTIIRVMLSAMWAATLFAQAPATSPAFEVASIRVVDHFRPGNVRTDASRFYNPYITLKGLLTRAYAVPAYQIDGPDWLDSIHYEVNGKIPTDSSPEQIPAMLRTLLVDRFGLKSHQEERTVSAFALSVGPGGPKLKASPVLAIDPSGAPSSPTGFTATALSGGHLVYKGIGIGALAASLSGFLGRPVLDVTGIEGRFDIELNIDTTNLNTPPKELATGDAPSPPDPSGGSVFSEVRALGLKIELRNIPMQIVVVDRIERSPTEN